ncbi:MAG: hypothetical protein K2F87_00750, partial [Muribaculaceae bacterium]|nr:hypothetical protein [Muribaculaceae bacterium]
AIAKVLTANAPVGTTVEQPRIPAGNAGKGIIKVTTLIASPEAGDVKKSTVTYAFYAATRNPSRLGSVAIYATDATTILSLIRRRKSLFGYSVIDARLEYGRRPFIDVTLTPQ